MYKIRDILGLSFAFHLCYYMVDREPLLPRLSKIRKPLPPLSYVFQRFSFLLIKCLKDHSASIIIIATEPRTPLNNAYHARSFFYRKNNLCTNTLLLHDYLTFARLPYLCTITELLHDYPTFARLGIFKEKQNPVENA